jgi:VRR-NUC domain
MNDLRIPAKLAHQGSEDSLQVQCAEWLKKELLKHNVPQELFWHIPSEGIRKPQYRAKLKMMGFKPGIPDVCLMLPRGEHHGVFCELKKAGGSPSPVQKKMISALTSQGYLCFVINDFETFKEVFSYYIENRK